MSCLLSVRRLTISLTMLINPSLIQERVHKMHQSRFGVSLVAGVPLPIDLQTSVVELQEILNNLTVGSVILINPPSLHLTILRSKSVETPINNIVIPNTFIQMVREIDSFYTEWSSLTLDTDGGIRAHLSPDCYPTYLRKQGANLARQISDSMALQITYQDNSWLTIATLNNTLHANDYANLIIDLLLRTTLPIVIINKLKLIYYHDLCFVKTEVISDYVLH